MGQQQSRAIRNGNGNAARLGLGESQRLLPPDDAPVDHDGCFPPHGLHEPCPANPHADLPVYTTIHRCVSALLYSALLEPTI